MRNIPAAILDVILKLPPVKQAMASCRIKSLYPEALITELRGRDTVIRMEEK